MFCVRGKEGEIQTNGGTYHDAEAGNFTNTLDDKT